MTILATARALLALLQPLTGNRSSGVATVAADPGPNAVLPANSYAVPIIAGDKRFDLLLRVDTNPAAAEGWTVDDGGTPVTMTSVVGGTAMNLPSSTVIEWWPKLAGIEATSVISTALTGATSASGPGALAQVTFVEGLHASSTEATEDFFESIVTAYPAAILAWEGAGPPIGDVVSPLEQRGARIGRGVHLHTHQWDLFVVTSRDDTDPEFREAGLSLLDAITEQTIDRQTVDGLRFSTPTGLQIVWRGRWLVTTSFYVYWLRFATVSSVKARDPRTFNPWLEARIDVDTEHAEPLEIVEDNRFPMS